MARSDRRFALFGHRPLIIDQPEKNLDPKSIYYELVPLSQAAKRKCQVIMATHNANWDVNADADRSLSRKLNRSPEAV